MGERGVQPGLPGMGGDQSEAPRRPDGKVIKGKNSRGIGDGGKQVFSSSTGRIVGEEKPSSYFSQGQEAIKKKHEEIEDKFRPGHGLRATYMMTYPNGETVTEVFSEWEIKFYKANGCTFKRADVPGEESWKGRADLE
jgi:hypothetical protein